MKNSNIKSIKTRKLFLLVLPALIIFALISCKKEVGDENTETINLQKGFSKVKDYSLSNIPLIKNKQNIQKLLTNPEDKDDEKINQYLYEISLATRELVKDANFNRVIIQMAKESSARIAYLRELETTAPRYFSEINDNLAKSGLTLNSIADDLTHKPIGSNPDFPETEEVEEYEPAIFIPNLPNIDLDKQPIISPNIEVDASEDDSLEDNIIAWYYTQDGNLEEIVLSEETSLKTTNPLFLLDNAEPGIKNNKNTQYVQAGDEPNEKTTTAFHSYEFRINYHYEPWTSGASELNITAWRIAPDGTPHSVFNNWNSRLQIDKVKRKDIGKNLAKWKRHCGNYTPYQYNYVFWNTYERDWNRSPKDLGKPTANGTKIYLSGRRKYISEWYAWIPSTVQIHDTDLNYIYHNWAKWYNSWKGKYRIWRVEL